MRIQKYSVHIRQAEEEIIKNTGEYKKYLDDLLHYANELGEGLPAGFSYDAKIENNDVIWTFKGPRLGTFAFILGGELAIVIYDGDRRLFRSLIDHEEELRIFMRESLTELVDFIQGNEPVIEKKRLFSKKKILIIPGQLDEDWCFK